MCKAKIITHDFKKFNIDDNKLLFVSSFKYLGHIISLMMLLNEKLGIYTCMLTFWQGCTVDVVGVLNLCYLSFCMCFHDTCLWRQHSSALRGFKSAYHRCLKLFFNYNRYDSVTNMLYFLGLPSFNTVIINARLSLCVY